jgi:hypothetical protein
MLSVSTELVTKKEDKMKKVEVIYILPDAPSYQIFIAVKSALLFLLLTGLCKGNLLLGQDRVPTEFIPKNFVVLDSAQTDFTGDGIRDYVVVLHHYQEDSVKAARPLLILRGRIDGSYSLLARADSVILCNKCGGVYGDPYSGMEAHGSVLTFEYYGGSAWRWTRTTTFLWDITQGHYILTRDEGDSFQVFEPELKEHYILQEANYGTKKLEEYRYNDL